MHGAMRSHKPRSAKIELVRKTGVHLATPSVAPLCSPLTKLLPLLILQHAIMSRPSSSSAPPHVPTISRPAVAPAAAPRTAPPVLMTRPVSSSIVEKVAARVLQTLQLSNLLPTASSSSPSPLAPASGANAASSSANNPANGMFGSGCQFYIGLDMGQAYTKAGELLTLA